MASLINQYVTRKGEYGSKGKLVKIDLANELLFIEDFYGKTEGIWFHRGLDSLRKSSKAEVEAAQKRAEMNLQKAKEMVSATISESEIKAEVKPYTMIDMPISVVNDITKKFDLDEVETWTWQTVEDAVKANQSEEISQMLNDGLRYKRHLKLANNRIVSLDEQLILQKEELDSAINRAVKFKTKYELLVNEIELWRDEEYNISKLDYILKTLIKDIEVEIFENITER